MAGWDTRVENAITGASQKWGVDPKLLKAFARIESGGRPNARTGSYKGLFQLSDSEFGKYGGGNIYDPDANASAAAQKLAREAQGFKAKYGRDPAPNDLYMIHQQGEGGYAAHTANPNAPAWQNMYSTAEGRKKGSGWAKQAIWGNVPSDVRAQYPGGVDSLTSQQFLDLWAQKVARMSGDAQPSTHMAANAVREVANGAPKTMASPIGGAPVAGGPVPLDLVQPSQRQSKLAEALLQKGLTAKPQGWGDVLNSLSATFAGQYLGDKADKQQQAYQGKLAQALMGASGDTNNLATTLIGSGNPELVQQGVALKVAQAKPQTQVGRFRPSKQGVIDTVTGQVVPGTEGNTAEAAEYGTSPQYFVDKDGNLKVGQLSKAGGMKPVDLPEGAKAWSPGIDYKDTGTGFVGLNKRTGQVEGSVAKDVAGEASATVAGKAQGQANVDLPSVESATNVLLGRIDDVANDPYLTRMTGPMDARLPNVSGDSVRIQSKIDQLQGDAFLQAFESIKGAGQISEVEGAKAEKAKSRLTALGVNDKDYPAALNDFKNEVVRLRDLVRAKAGKGAAPAPATRLKYNPATGEFE